MNDYERGRADERAAILSYMADVKVMHLYDQQNVKGRKVAGRHHADAMQWAMETIECGDHFGDQPKEEWEALRTRAYAWFEGAIAV